MSGLIGGEWAPGVVRRWSGDRPREDYRAVLAERYAPASWWPTPAPDYDDSELTCARRRRELEREFYATDRKVETA